MAEPVVTPDPNAPPAWAVPLIASVGEFKTLQTNIGAIVAAEVKKALPPPAKELVAAGGDAHATDGEKTTLAKLQQSVEALTAANKEKDARIDAERRLSAVRATVQKFPFFDAEDAVREIAPAVKEKDGRYFLPGKEIVSGVEVDREFDLDTAVKQLSQRKPHWVKADVKAGSGASGGSSGSNITAGARRVTTADLRNGVVDANDLVTGKVVVVD